MKRTDVVVVGGGQAGLAASRCLQARGVDHTVLERGRVGERWRSERWDSLRLLTPRWQSRLPGFSYRGPDPDGFMSRREVIGYLEAYARSFAAPVEAGVAVHAVERDGDGYRVTADRGAWRARSVIVATGHCDRAHVPPLAAELPADVVQLVPARYRNPRALPAGGVLVVGASATGLQLADELHRSGRPVTLAVGRHVRLPRRYRGRDVMEWLDATGILDEGADAVADLEAARRQPSLQLVGRPDHRTLDLGVLLDEGVRLVGRVQGVEGGRVLLAEDLDETIAAAERRLARLLGRIEAHVAQSGAAAVPPPEPIRAISPPPAPRAIDLRADGIRTVIWATGYRRSYPWLRVPVLDERGEIRHAGGVTPAPGLYVLGLQFLRRRNSSFLDGVGKDAAVLVDHLATRLARRSAA
ncbi:MULTISPECIES: NAD(P)/FAD-dependent oxidoreductase [Anaeromyxobacter]|uniref:flavin-containing monooxygenase n=1 Tax=Anaeromyxobacter TaxID=161492 RepID=UPI001F58A340|nr:MULTISPECIES: NAD(P)/FAD-dependent oxidoreductase [unclassified Anaeromyxobacter]